MLVFSIASVSASDVSNISDNQDSNILNNYDLGSSDSTSSVNENNNDYDGSIGSGSSDSLADSDTAIGSSGSGSSDNTVSNNDESSIDSTNSNGNSYDISSASENNPSVEGSSADNGNSSTGNQSVKTEKTPTKITNSGKSIVNGKTYYLTLKDSNGNALSGKTVSLTFNGKKYTKTTNSKGKVGLKISGIVAKTYKLTYKFVGDENLTSSAGSVKIKIKMASALTGSGTSIVKGKKYTVTLKNSKGKVLAGRTVVFTINGKTFKKKTNSKGIATLKMSLPANRTYNLTYSYAGSSYYGNSSKTVSLFVKTPTEFVKSGSSVVQGKSYYLTLKDSDGNVLAGKKVKITYRGKTYLKTTNSKGKVGLKIKSAPGYKYRFSYKYGGNGEYGSSSGTLYLKVKEATSLTNYTSNNISDGTAFKVILKDSNGYVLKNKVITFTFDGKNYTKKTNSKGIASLKINRNEEENYTLSFKYAGSSYYASSKGTINITVNNVTGGAYGGNIMDYSSVTKRGNTAQYKKGLNEIANLTEAQLNAYLKSSGKDALNSAIKTLASKLVSEKSTTWQKAQAIFNYVRDNISYSYYSDSKKGAKSTLSSKSANCCDQANLVVALCRAANIPARFSHGQGCRFSSGLVTGHVWAQIYVDGVWYSADATSSRNSLGNIKNWNVKSFYSLKQYAHLPF